MVFALLELVASAVVLGIGAHSLVRGTGRILSRRGISFPTRGGVVLGVTVEAVALALTASVRREPALAAGVAFGGIQVMLAVAFGVGLLLARRPVEAPDPTVVLMPAAALLATALALSDQMVSPFEGLGLVAIAATYVVLVVTVKGRALGWEREARTGDSRVSAAHALGVGAGVVMVAAGAVLVLTAASRAADRTHLDPGFVGAAIVGLVAVARHAFAFVPAR